MGASGTTVALETADVALMADELDKLPAAIRLARRAMRVVHQSVAPICLLFGRRDHRSWGVRGFAGINECRCQQRRD
jgi:hypothetical protein